MNILEKLSTSIKKAKRENPLDTLVQNILEGRNNPFRYGEKVPEGVTVLNDARKFAPQLYQQFEDEKITASQMDEILRTGRVKDWKKEAIQKIAKEQETPEVLGSSNFQTETLPGSKLYTNKDEVYNWTTSPTYEGVPQKAVDFYGNYNYEGNGQFANPLNPEYIQLLWNEIGQQMPNQSLNTKIAFLETMLAIAHAESHGGQDAGYIDGRLTNVFNLGYNATPSSVLKYDPEDPKEMADRAVNSMINDFGILENKGLTDQVIHNYHIGPNAPYNQQAVDTYKSYLNGWESLYNPTYPWE